MFGHKRSKSSNEIYVETKLPSPYLKKCVRFETFSREAKVWDDYGFIVVQGHADFPDQANTFASSSEVQPMQANDTHGQQQARKLFSLQNVIEKFGKPIENYFRRSNTYIDPCTSYRGRTHENRHANFKRHTSSTNQVKFIRHNIINNWLPSLLVYLRPKNLTQLYLT